MTKYWLQRKLPPSGLFIRNNGIFYNRWSSPYGSKSEQQRNSRKSGECISPIRQIDTDLNSPCTKSSSSELLHCCNQNPSLHVKFNRLLCACLWWGRLSRLMSRFCEHHPVNITLGCLEEVFPLILNFIILLSKILFLKHKYKHIWVSPLFRIKYKVSTFCKTRTALNKMV